MNNIDVTLSSNAEDFSNASIVFSKVGFSFDDVIGLELEVDDLLKKYEKSSMFYCEKLAELLGCPAPKSFIDFKIYL